MGPGRDLTTIHVTGPTGVHDSYRSIKCILGIHGRILSVFEVIGKQSIWTHGNANKTATKCEDGRL